MELSTTGDIPASEAGTALKGASIPYGPVLQRFGMDPTMLIALRSNPFPVNAPKFGLLSTGGHLY